MRKVIYMLLLFGIVPVSVFAQLDLSTYNGIIYSVNSVFDTIAVALVSISVVTFIYGVFKYIQKGDNEAFKKEGKDLIIYGILGIFIMTSVWGLTKILTNTFFPGGTGNDINGIIDRVQNNIDNDGRPAPDSAPAQLLPGEGGQNPYSEPISV